MARAPVTPNKLRRGERLRALRDHFGVTQEAFLGSAKRVQVVGAESGRNNLTGQLLLDYARRVGAEPEDMRAYFNGERSITDLLAGRQPDPVPPLKTAETAHVRTFTPERQEQRERGLLSNVRKSLLKRYSAELVDAVVAGSEFIDAQNINELQAFDALEEQIKLVLGVTKLPEKPRAEHPKKPPRPGKR